MCGRGIISKNQNGAFSNFCNEPGKTFASFGLGKFQGSSAPSRGILVERDPGMPFTQILENSFPSGIWRFPQFNHKLACQIFECKGCPRILHAVGSPGEAPRCIFSRRFHSVRFSGRFNPHLSA